jgi:hypothetical protein
MAYLLARQDIGCKLSSAKSEDPAQRHVLRGFSCKPVDLAYPTNVISDGFWRLTGRFSRNLLTSQIWYGFFKWLFLSDFSSGFGGFCDGVCFGFVRYAIAKCLVGGG